MADDHASANGAVPRPVVESRSQQCNICNKKFKSAKACEQHLQSGSHGHRVTNTHGGPTPVVEVDRQPINTKAPPVKPRFRCRFCDKNFESASAFALHYRSGVHRPVVAATSSWPRFFEADGVGEEEEGEEEGEFLAAPDSNVEDDNYEHFVADEALGEEFEGGYGEFSYQLASADVAPEIVPGPPLSRKELQDLVAAMGGLDVR
ncbi:hypothetical protein H1R20_g9, partial [Candolleomyces eurysporus]